MRDAVPQPIFEPPERFNIAEYFLGDRVREGRGGRRALLTDAGEISYAEVEALANRYGHLLRGAGVRPEERVLLALPDGPDFAGALFGALRIGAVVVMLNPYLRPDEISYFYRYTRGAVLLVDSARAPHFRAVRAVRDEASAAPAPGTGREAGAPAGVPSGIPWSEGPAAALERAFLLLEGGAIPDGIAALQAALPNLAPSLATEMLDLALALSEVTTVGAALAAKAAIARHRGRSGEAVGIVREGIDRVPAADRPAILALGARAADQADLGAEATAFRRRIVAEHHDAREYPEAALMLARAVALEPGGRDEALGILEALIVGHPESPVVPGARRELDRIRAGGAG